MNCGAIEVFAEAIPKAYDDPKLLEEYCRSLKYLMHKGTMFYCLRVQVCCSEKNETCPQY